MAKRWHPDIAPPGKQLEHERHLKAINEAADQLERLAEESRGGKVTRNAVKVSARGRAQAPRRGGRARLRRGAAPARAASRRPASSTTRSARACPTTRSCTATRAASPIPSGASGASTASTSPATATTSSSGRACLPRRHPHGARRLAAVRRLLQARPRRRARAALHDRGQARARRGRLRARRAPARLRARRRAAQHRRAAADDARVLAGGRLPRRRARRARLGARGGRPAGAAPLRRAHLRGHGLARRRPSTPPSARPSARRATRRRGSALGRLRLRRFDRAGARDALERARALAPSERGPARPRARRAPARRRRRRGVRVRAGDAARAGVGGRVVAPRPRAGAHRPHRRSAWPRASARSRSATTPRCATCATQVLAAAPRELARQTAAA